MHVGITGGTGFLGRHLARRLAARGDRVTIFTRRPEAAQPHLPAEGMAVGWDPLGEPLPSDVLETLDAVVHLAGEPVAGLWTRSKRRRIRDSRWIGTRHVVEGLRRVTRRPAVLLSASASGFYGDGGDRELTESSPPGTGFLAEVCRGWEAEAERATELDLRVVALRTGLPLSPDGGFLHALLPAFRRGLGVRFGSGRQWMPWIHRDDWVDLVCFVLEKDTVHGPVNLAAPAPVPNEVFTRTVASAVGRRARLGIPAFVLRLAGAQAREMALAGQRMVPAKAQDARYRFRHPELGPALDDLLGM